MKVGLASLGANGAGVARKEVPTTPPIGDKAGHLKFFWLYCI